MRLDPVTAASVLDSVLPALFGFAGVLAGAILTPWMHLWLDNRRELEQARTAWVLLREDADAALRAVHERQRKGKWPIAWRRDWSGVWRSSRGALARRVASPTRFRSVADAFERMDELESAVNTTRPDQDRYLSDKDKEFLASIESAILRARQALAGELDDRNFSPSAVETADQTEDAGAT
jgi:hypothetical protein